jgi:regulator of sigma E protease
MNLVIYLLSAFLALSFLVFFHELGHYISAKFFGVTVERFSIGFGKVLGGRRCCGTEWVFSAIPLGGYVRMKGQDDSDPTLTSDDLDSYSSKKPWQRIVILLAGPLANIILAFFIYLSLAIGGAPLIAAQKYLPPVVGKVQSQSPAEKAGLRSGDRISEICGRDIEYWFQISKAIQDCDGKVKMTVIRDGERLPIDLSTMAMDATDEFGQSVRKKVIGISPEAKRGEKVYFSLPGALYYAWNETVEGSLLIVKSVFKMGTGEIGTENVGGPITIFDILMKFAERGLPYLLFISALISINLGVLNLFPIPALDGGHIVFNLYEAISGRAPSETVYYRITVAGWAILGGLLFLGLYNDISRYGGIHG